MAQGADASGKRYCLLISVLPAALEVSGPAFTRAGPAGRAEYAARRCGYGCIPERQKRQEVPPEYRVRFPRGWGNSQDIAPYVDPVFRNNVILPRRNAFT